MAKQSVSLQRRIVAHPHPKYYALFKADAFSQIRSESSLLGQIIKEYYDKLPEQRLQMLSKIFANMKPEQVRSNKGHISKHD